MNGNTDRERIYAVENTVFVICQYFCCTEIVRREMQRVSTENDSKIQSFLHCQDAITDAWGAGKRKVGSAGLLRIFAGEQRAIGELFVQASDQGAQCIGYGKYLKDETIKSDPLIGNIRADVVSLAQSGNEGTLRLITIHRNLIDLLRILDPNHIRFRQEFRSYIPGS